MERLKVLLLAALLLGITFHGVVTFRAADQAHDDQAELACLQRAQATATIALLAPSEAVDEEGRIEAIRALSGQIDGC